MPLYGWSAAYSVGIPTIDEQHKQLFSIINQLHAAMMSGQTKLVMGSTLGQLVQYTLKHFAWEEDMLRQRRYPELAQHRIIHEQFTARVHELRLDFESGKLAMGVEVMDFLQKWLVGHIEGTDRKYATYLRKAAAS